MNPLQILAVFLLGGGAFVTSVSMMYLLGLSLVNGIALFYLAALWFMLSLQRRAIPESEFEIRQALANCDYLDQNQDKVSQEAREIRRHVMPSVKPTVKLPAKKSGRCNVVHAVVSPS